MTAILIDGYNLIGTDHRDQAAARARLIERLIAYRKRKGHDITVVFDGWKSGRADESRSVTGGVSIIYSRLAERADSVIKRIVVTSGRDWIVVTSDRDIADHAWSAGSVPVPSAAFEQALQNAAETLGAFEPLEDETGGQVRKGRSRVPSRKEKALSRALRKL